MTLALFLALGLGSARADEVDDALYDRLLGPEETSAYDVAEAVEPAALPTVSTAPTDILRSLWPVGGLLVVGGVLLWGRKLRRDAPHAVQPDLRVVSRVSLGGTSNAVLVEVVDGSGATRRMLLGAAGSAVPTLVADLSPMPVPVAVPEVAAVAAPVAAPSPIPPMVETPAALEAPRASRAENRSSNGRFGALLRRFEDQAAGGNAVTRKRVEAAQSLVQGMLADRAARGDQQ